MLLDVITNMRIFVLQRFEIQARLDFSSKKMPKGEKEQSKSLKYDILQCA